MKRINCIFFAFLSIILFFSWSCSGFDSESNSDSVLDSHEEHAEKAYITFAPLVSRTILPSYSVDDMTDFVLKGTHESNTTTLGEFATKSALQSARIVLDEGTWIFTLTAKKGGSSFSGTVSGYEVKMGDNPLSFTLSLDEETISAEDGNGTVSVKITFPADSGVRLVKAGLFNEETDAEISGFELEAIAITDNAITYEKEEVPAGTYRLKVFFYGDENAQVYMSTFKEIVVVAADCTSSAERSIENLNELYTVTYEKNGGNFASGAVIQETLSRHSEISLPTSDIISRTGYEFKGWYADSTFTQAVTEIAKGTTENVTVWVKWEPIVYSIGYGNLKDSTGTGVAAYTIESDEITLYMPLRAGATFAGWYESETFEGNAVETIPTGTWGDKTFYAKWNLINYEITYNLNGGTNATANPVTYTVEDAVTLADATRTGYALAGWYTEESFETKINEIEIGTMGSVTLYAKWVVTAESFDAFDGSCVAENEIVYYEGNLTTDNLSTLCDKLAQVECDFTLDLSEATGMTSIRYKNYDNGYHSYFENCNNLKTIVLPKNLKTIEKAIFYNCSSLESVRISDSVTSIGNSAFFGCTSLESLDIPNSVTTIGSYVFKGCSNLKSITIPEGVTSIENDTFNGCTSLESVEIPASVTSIRYRAFKDCTNLKSITIPSGVTSIGFSAFEGCSSLESVEIPSGVTSIGARAFKDCTSLESLVIPSGVTSIENVTFYGCSNLKSLTIPETVTSIGAYAFQDCTSLEALVIPIGVTSIGKETFYGCASLSTLTIPNNVLSIGTKAFFGCSNLKTVYYAGNLNAWLSISFQDWGANPCCNGADLYIGNELVTDVVIPETISVLNDYSFEGCTSLVSITIPNTVNYIGCSFCGCVNLSNIILPSNLETIKLLTFSYCSNLETITIPAGVTSIGTRAFSYCSNLETITIPATVTSIGEEAFSYCTKLKKIIFLGTKAQWNAITKEHYWNFRAGTGKATCSDGEV